MRAFWTRIELSVDFDCEFKVALHFCNDSRCIHLVLLIEIVEHTGNGDRESLIFQSELTVTIGIDRFAPFFKCLGLRVVALRRHGGDQQDGCCSKCWNEMFHEIVRFNVAFDWFV